jgi:cell division protein YceG involved in septum cleavage
LESLYTKTLRTLITLFLIVVLAVGGWLAWQVYVPMTPPANTSLLLHSGYSTRRIAAELKAAGVIRSELVFRVWHELHPKPSLKAGEYRFERAATLPQVYERIARGDIYFHVVTIPEGYTMFDIAKVMEEAGLGSAADFLHVAETETQLISDLAPEATSLEGYLFPNTYQFTRTQSLEEMAAAMVHQFRVGGATDRAGRRTELGRNQGGDHGVDRGERRLRLRRNASARSQRLLQPAGAEDGARCRSERDLCGALLAGTYSGKPPSRRSGRGLSL